MPQKALKPGKGGKVMKKEDMWMLIVVGASIIWVILIGMGLLG